MPQAHVQVVLGGPQMPAGLEPALRRVGATASFGPMSEVLRSGLKATADAVVVVASDDAQSGCDGLVELFNQVAHHPRATLVLHSEGTRMRRPLPPAALPVSFSTGTSAEDLAARIATMIEMRPSLESLHRSGAAGRQADEQLADTYRQQLCLASQLQRELLPHVLPRCQGVSFSTVYRPVDYVSGDIYDIRRLDDDHVAVALVDAQGHGICAALLTVFIKRALRGEMSANGGSQSLQADEMLSRLNEELLEADLSESQFAAAVYARLDLRTRRVELARGGAPYPIRRHADGSGELVRPAGPVVGVAPHAAFAVASFVLLPGESLILYSDGVEQIVKSADSFGPPGPTQGVPPDATPDADRPANVAPDETIATTRWYKQLRDDGVAAALQQLERRHDTLRRLGHPLDDMTVLAINVEG